MSAFVRDASFIVGKKKPGAKEAVLDEKKMSSLKKHLEKYEAKK